jgi:hypothetical protein
LSVSSLLTASGSLELVWLEHAFNYILLWIFLFFNEARGAASNSAYYGYPELWILRYPAHRYHAVPSPGFDKSVEIMKIMVGLFFVVHMFFHGFQVKEKFALSFLGTIFGCDWLVDLQVRLVQ